MKVVTAHMGHREESHSPPLLRYPVVRGNKGNVSISLRNLEAKGLVVVSRTRGGKLKPWHSHERVQIARLFL